MHLHLSDIEANATKHALDEYMENLSSSSGEAKALDFEKKAVQGVLDKLSQSSGASGT
jgi:hypothetical protein